MHRGRSSERFHNNLLMPSVHLVPGWLRRYMKARRKARAIAQAREKRREGVQVPVVPRHVPTYPSEPVVRPQRHRRGLKGRFRA